MSKRYTHLLVPQNAQYIPTPDQLSGCISDLCAADYLSDSVECTIAEIQKREPQVRTGINPFTGEPVELTMPSRMALESHACSISNGINGITSNKSEYDLRFTSSVLALNVPLDVGYYDGDRWKFVDMECYYELAFHIRDRPVCLSMASSIDEFTKPPSFDSIPKGIFDEDMSPTEAPGVFNHPDIGPYVNRHAGCARFWISMEFGNFVFPRSSEDGVDLAEKGFVDILENSCGCAFTQSSHEM